MDALKKRLNGLLIRRDQLEKEQARIKGRLDSAQNALERVEQECRSRKVDPDKLDTVIATLTQKCQTEIALLEDQIIQAEKEIAPYWGKDS